jgi:hypothetical protein
VTGTDDGSSAGRFDAARARTVLVVGLVAFSVGETAVFVAAPASRAVGWLPRVTESTVAAFVPAWGVAVACGTVLLYGVSTVRAR